MGYLTENDPALTASFLPTMTSILSKINLLFSDIDCAILYQLLLSCLKSFPTRDLVSICFDKFDLLQKFYPLKQESRRVLELQVISHFIRIDKKYLSKFQVFIVECLESLDETVRSLAIDVLFDSVQENNCRPIVTQIQNYIRVTSNVDLQKRALNRLLSVLETMAPSPEWYVQNVWELMVHSRVSQRVIARVLYNKQDMFHQLSQERLPEVVANLMISMSEIIERKQLNQELAHCFVWFLGQNIHVLRVLQYSHSQVLDLLEFLDTRLDLAGQLALCETLYQLRRDLDEAEAEPEQDILISGDVGRMREANSRLEGAESGQIGPVCR